MKVFEYVVVREFTEKDEHKLALVAGPFCVTADDEEQVKVIAVCKHVVETEIVGIKVLVRPFRS